MELSNLIKELVDILVANGNMTVYINKPSFTDGHYDGNDLEDNWDIYTDDIGMVILK